MKKKEQVHSRAYHRYFEGFAEQQAIDTQGRLRIQRVYVGSYYRRDLSDRQRRYNRILYAVLYLIGLACYLWAGTRDPGDTGTGLVRFTGIPVVLALIAVAWLAIPLLRNLTAPKEMMVRTYRDTCEDLIRASLFAMILQLLNVAASLTSLMLAPYQNTGTVLTSTAAYCISSVAFFGIFVTERRIPYEKLSPRKDRPKDSSVIRYQNTF